MGVRTALLLGVGVVAVSVSAPVTAAIAMPAVVIAFWRTALTSLLMAGPVVSWRRDEVRGLLAVDRRSLVLAVTAGLCLALHFGFWIASLTMTSVASSVAILSLQVVWVLLWDVSTGVRLPPMVLLGVAGAVAGAVVVGGLDLSLSRRALTGDLLALVGAAAIAAYTVIGSHARRRLSTLTYTFVCYGATAGFLLVAATLAGLDLVGYSGRDWALLLVVTLAAQLVGHSVFIHLLAVVSPMTVSLALLLEIPGAALIAAVWLGQIPGVAPIAGLLLMLAGMVVVVLRSPARTVAVSPT